MEKNGRVTLVTELRGAQNDGARNQVVLRATPERLISELLDTTDPLYVEEFLLTYRTFIKTPLLLAHQLLVWFDYGNEAMRFRVFSIMKQWMTNHFNDFESNPVMMEVLENFEAGLEREGMSEQQR